MAELKKLKPRHDAIMEWLLANPEKTQGDCARAFGVTQAWMSTIVNSHVFQSRYQTVLQDRMESQIMPLRDKLVGLVDASVEKLMLQVEVTSDPQLCLNIVDKVGKRLPPEQGGEQPRPNGGLVQNTQLNFYASVSKEELEKARETYRRANPVALPPPTGGDCE